MKLFLSAKRWKPEYSRRFDGVFIPYRTSSGETHEVPPHAQYVTLSIFGDTKGLRKDPTRSAVSITGERALKGKNLYDGFAWSWVCPTEPTNKKHILDLIARIPSDRVILLEDLQFPNERYCYCSRCVSDRERRAVMDIVEWRVKVINELWETILKSRPFKYALTVHPDPFGLRERYGIDLQTLKNRIEFLHIPIYCTSYTLTYWIDILVPSLLKVFSDFEVYFEVYAVEPKPLQVLKAIFVISKYNPDGIVLYDHTDKHLHISRLLNEDDGVKNLVQKVKNPVFQGIVDRIRSWIWS